MNSDFIFKEMDEVIKLYRKESYVLCLHKVNLILLTDRNNYEALSYKGACLKNLNSFHEAIRIFNQCLEITEKDSHIWVFRGDCYFKLKNYQKAIQDYYQALIIDPTNTAVEDKVARGMYFLGNIEEAILIMKHAIKKGDSPEPLLVLIAMLNKNGREVEAIKIACLGEKLFPEETRFSKFFKDTQLEKKQIN